MEKSGRRVLSPSQGQTIDDEIERVQLDCGLTSPYFVTELKTHGVEFENPLILLGRRLACCRCIAFAGGCCAD